MTGLVRCAYCHEGLEAASARACAGCRTLLHPDCAAGLARCPTLGCQEALPGIAVPDATQQAAPTLRRRVLWVVFGLVLPLLAFAVDASLHKNPLAWGWGNLFVEEPGVSSLGAHPVLVLVLALLSMVGLVQALRGRAKAALPLVTLGVVVAGTHALVFLPLLPVSLFAVLFLGVGLLGFLPFFTLWVYVDVLRHLGRELQTTGKHDDHPLVGARFRGRRRLALVAAPLLLVGGHFLSPPPLAVGAPAARHMEGVDVVALRRAAEELSSAGFQGTVDPSALQGPLAEVAASGQVFVAVDHVSVRWPGEDGYPYGYSLIFPTAGQDLPSIGGTCYRSVEIAPGIWSQYFLKSPPPGGDPLFQRLTDPEPWGWDGWRR